jgi:hypothetical protein
MKGSIMKKLVILLAMLLIASPAMAAVEITLSCDGAVATVGYTTDGEIVRAFALDVTVDGGAIIDVNHISTDYYIAPGSVSISDGAISNGGNIVASDDFPGTLGGVGTGGVTIEMASLYADGEPAPGTSGTLFTIEGDADANVAVVLNTIRAGVILEDASAATVVLPADCLIEGAACLGDIALTTSAPGEDGKVDIGDLQRLLNAMFAASPPTFEVDYATYANIDIALTTSAPGQDGKVDIGDLQRLLNDMFLASPPNFEVSCF